MRPSHRHATSALLALLSLVPSCSSSEADGGASGPVVIAWIPKEQNNPVFELAREGATKAAADLTRRSGRAVEALYLAPTGTNAAEKIATQVQLVRDAVARKVSAISISCNDAVKLGAAIDEAVAAGIPVMTWDSDAPASRRFTYYGMDNRAGGVMAARLLARLLGDTGEVAVVSGTKGAANLDQRVDGFYDEINVNHAGMRVVAREYCDDDPPTCAAKVEDVMARRPTLKGWFFAGLWALTTESKTAPGETNMPAWESATKAGAMKTVVFDTLPFELELLKRGKVHGLIGQKYFGWGYDSVTMAFERVTQGRKFQEFTDSKFDVVCESNREAMSKAWESKDFTGPLGECSLVK